MVKKITRAIPVLIAVLFVGAIAGTIFCYNGVVNDRNSKIASMNSKIANLNCEISNLTAQITNLTSANLVTSLGVTEISRNNMEYNGGVDQLYNHLYMTGWVNNTGEGTAYNAGLHVVAYDANGTLEMNMTVPLGTGEVFGTDSSIDAWYVGVSSLQFGNLYSEQNSTISINIFHEGIVSNWTVTPVWANLP